MSAGLGGIVRKTFLIPAAVIMTCLGCNPIKESARSITPPLKPGESTNAEQSASKIPTWAGQRQDEPFNVKEFLESRTPPAENAATQYNIALAKIGGDYGSDQGKQLEEQIKQLAIPAELASRRIPLEQVKSVLERAAPAEQLIDAAQSRSKCLFVTDLRADDRMLYALPARSLARLSILHVYHGQVTGDFSESEKALWRSFRISRDLQPRAGAVIQLVSFSIDSMLFMAIDRVILSDPRLRSEQCDRLLTLLAEHERESLDRFDEGLKCEYILARNTIQDLQTGRLSLAEMFELFTGDRGEDGLLEGYARLNYEAEIAACNRLFAIALAEPESLGLAAGTPSPLRTELARFRKDWDDWIAKMKSAPPAEKAKLLPQMPAQQSTTWTAGIEPLASANRRNAAKLAGTQMLIALRRYEIVHGSLPETLDEAAAEKSLKKVPIDPYDGAPLRYALVEGKPTIYSIGKDLKDDGGRIDAKFGDEPGDFLFVLPR